MISVEEIREKLASVSSGELPLWDFYNWLEEASLNMHADSSDDAIALVGNAGIIFAEYDRGGLKQSDLVAKLCGLVHMAQIYRTVNASPWAVRWLAGSDLTLLAAGSAQI